MANFEIPGYELFELLGRGGMATVYRALHLNLDREVAVKIMDTSLNTDSTFAERFIREARISARLVHPHILQIYDVNSYDSLNYISMELLEGGDLADFIRGAMNQGTIYCVIEQMAEALDYAAGKGYVHRDIKPSNIMVREESDYVLADFGIAKASNSSTQMTQTGLMVGTPSYMSPEQAKGIEVDGRSDLYSLTVLCYEMLTKELPYESDSAVSTAVKHLTEAIPTLPEHLAPYQSFIDRGMAKEPNDRFQTGEELYAAFCEVRSLFSDEDILTPPGAPSAGGTTASNTTQEMRTSIAWDDSTQVVAPSKTSLAWDDATQVAAPARPSRPYKLTDTSQREPLVSGIRTGARPAQKKPSAVGGTGFKLLAGVLVIGALGFGGYTYWQNQQSGSTEDLRALTAELATAYTALNGNQLQQAALAFRRVLAIDSNHASAQQGLAEVEQSFVAAIESALGSGDVRSGEQLILDFSLLFSSSGEVERLQSSLAQAGQDQQLESAQSERIVTLLDKANKAFQQGKLFAPPADNTYEFFERVRAMDANNSAATDGLKMLASAAVEQAIEHIDKAQLGDAQDLLDGVRRIDPQYPELAEADAALKRGRQASVAKVDTLVLRARQSLSKGNFSSAGNDLAEAAALAPGRDDIEQLQAQLPALEQAWQDKERLVQASDRARTLYNNGRYSEAASAYAEVLGSDPGSGPAQEGLRKSIAAQIANAEALISQGDFAGAQRDLTAVTDLQPREETAVRMLQELPGMEQQWQQQQAAAAARNDSARQLVIAGTAAVAEGDLELASQAYSELQNDYPDFEASFKLKSQLLSAYIEASRQEITNQEYDMAQEYIGLGKALAPNYAAWTELEEEIEVSRTSNRRRLGAY